VPVGCRYVFYCLFDCSLSEAQQEKLYYLMDGDGDGDLGFAEFVMFLATAKLLEEKCVESLRTGRSLTGSFTSIRPAIMCERCAWPLLNRYVNCARVWGRIEAEPEWAATAFPKRVDGRALSHAAAPAGLPKGVIDPSSPSSSGNGGGGWEASGRSGGAEVAVTAAAAAAGVLSRNTAANAARTSPGQVSGPTAYNASDAAASANAARLSTGARPLPPLLTNPLAAGLAIELRQVRIEL